MAMNQTSGRIIQCPGCGVKASYPSSLVQFRCAQCGMIFTAPKQPSGEQSQGRSVGASASNSSSDTTLILIGVGVTLVFLLLAAGGAFFYFQSRESQVAESQVAGEPDASESEAETDPPSQDAPSETPKITYEEIRLPESTRKKLYSDYRAVARTTLEKPLPLPQGSPPRAAMEKMLQQVFDRELTRFAALYRISESEVREVIKEGDAKNWDPSPRSNATRNGKRLYPEGMSEGWKPNSNVR
ncbi:MAG: hypothetical protein VX694_02240 [Planctomycetota bacterium]|nr:hypothetical protein [Planctomycetota bacterium]